MNRSFCSSALNMIEKGGSSCVWTQNMMVFKVKFGAKMYF